MDLPTTITYGMLPDGGVSVDAVNTQAAMSFQFSHAQALDVAARILAAAGVREATFTGHGHGRGAIREAQS
jgi:hypothetical protein